ncbi:MAG: IS6 family transposase [Hyphomonadaceae bacterium]|nr:IS6 family transposase [Hyphomonadaceae bacterium]
MSVVSCAGLAESAQTESHPEDVGVLVMAHGGAPLWNSEVQAMLVPLTKDYLLELAFGMAEAASLQDGVRKLEARGAKRHRFPPTVIQHAVWLYFRFTLSLRDVEEMMTHRGVDVSYETIRA